MSGLCVPWAMNSRFDSAFSEKANAGPAVHQPQHRTAAIGVVLDTGEDLEAAAQAPARALPTATLPARRPRRPRLGLAPRGGRCRRARGSPSIRSGPVRRSGRGVPLAERLERRELRPAARAETSPRRAGAARTRSRRASSSAGQAAPAASHSARSSSRRVGRRRQPHRLRVAAEALHPLLPGGRGSRAARGPARCAPSRSPSPPHREQHDRAVEVLGDPAGGDPHHPLVPALAPGDQDRRQRRARREQPHAPPPPPASPSVWRSRFQPSSSAASAAARPASRLSSSSRARSGSCSRPAALIRGPMRKPTSAAVNGGFMPGLLDQRLQPLRARLGQRLQAERRDHPVLAVQRHEVGDGAQAGDAQQRRRIERLAAPRRRGPAPA